MLGFAAGGGLMGRLAHYIFAVCFAIAHDKAKDMTCILRKAHDKLFSITLHNS
jgi:hypothetical protein